MKVVDANVLLYAVNRDADRHEPAHRWLVAALNRPEPLAFTWVVVLAFLRLSTSRVILPAPLDVDTATALVGGWLDRPGSVVLEPRLGHLARVRELLGATGSGGNLVNDAHLAAIALDHKAAVVTYDNDFARFPGVRWETPG